MPSTTYRVAALRPEGWETAATRTKRISAASIYERFATAQAVPVDYAAVRLETGTGRVVRQATVDATDLNLTDAQCAGLAELRGDGDLVAEIEADLARRAAVDAVTRPEPKRSDRSLGTRRATYVTLEEGPCAGVRAYTGTLYVAAHLTRDGWVLLGVTDEKARGLRLLGRRRTEETLAESLTTSAGREVYRAALDRQVA